MTSSASRFYPQTAFDFDYIEPEPTPRIPTPQSRPATERTSVYKYFDEHGILIYVGITARGINRNRQHDKDKAWWLYVANQEVEHFDTRESAHEREVALIQRFRPAFNTLHNCEAATIRAAYLALREGTGAGASLKELIHTCGKRTITLHPAMTQKRGVLVFHTDVVDSEIARCLKMKKRVPVLAGDHKVGVISKIDTMSLPAALYTDIHWEGRGVIKSAIGRLMIMSIKDRVIMLRNVRLEIA